jgi:hypothetical protein
MYASELVVIGRSEEHMEYGERWIIILLRQVQAIDRIKIDRTLCMFSDHAQGMHDICVI